MSDFEKHKTELQQVLEKEIFNSLLNLEDKAKDLDWFAGNEIGKEEELND